MKSKIMAKKKTKEKFIPHNSVAFFSRWLRDKRDLSQRDLAKLIGVHSTALARLEVNTHPLSLALTKKIYKVCSLDERKFLLDCLHSDLDRLFFE